MPNRGSLKCPQRESGAAWAIVRSVSCPTTIAGCVVEPWVGVEECMEVSAVGSSGHSVDTFEELPDPGWAGRMDDLVERLRLLKVWTGDPSYEWITGRCNAAWTAAGRLATEPVSKTAVVSCFQLLP